MHYDEAYKYLMWAEGGVLESDSEHGGAANGGLSVDLLRHYRGQEPLTEIKKRSEEDWAREKKQSIEDLKKVSDDERKSIFKKEFWDRMKGDEIAGRLTAIALLNQAIHRGVVPVRNSLNVTMWKRYGQEWNKPLKFKDMIPVLNASDDRKNLIEICWGAQEAYIELAEKDPAKYLGQQQGWKNRIFNLLRIIYE